MPPLNFSNRIPAILLGSALMLLSASAAAAPRATEDLPEPYKIPTPNPSTIEAVHDVTGDTDANWEGEIHQDLSERAVCGGWDMNDTVNGKIPVVYGVPGRNGIPLGNILAGMAYRDELTGALGNGYVFPNVAQVQGWSTACRAGFPPYLDDSPPCKDAGNNNYATPQKCESLCPRINAWQYPIWVRAWVLFDPVTLLPIDTKICVQNGKGEAPMNGSPLDGDCCERNGDGNGGPACTSTYGSDSSTNPRYDPFPGTMPPNAECLTDGAALEATGYVRVYHAFAGWYYCCTGAAVTKLEYTACTMSNPTACVQHPDARRNCVRCEGDGLPTGQIHPGAGLSCLGDWTCAAGFVCHGYVPPQVFATACANPSDCGVVMPCPEYVTCMSGIGDESFCAALYRDTCWECVRSKCQYPAVPGTCGLRSGAKAAIDYNGDLIPRGPSPLRQETGCRAGFGASINGSTMYPSPFVSYYRDYTAGYTRNAVDEAPYDQRSRSGIPVSCYGFYDEFDPKTRVTSVNDSRCVIAAYKSSNEFRLFYKTQLGRGSFGAERAFVDPDPTDESELRDPGFDEDEDLWYQNLGGGFSLLNGKKFKEAGQDMTFGLLSLDTTLERARGPMLRSASSAGGGASSSTRRLDPYKSFRSPGALRRAFDDSANNQMWGRRPFTEWWQKQETVMQDVVNPSVAHIVFPSSWSANLNLLHPFLSPDLSEPPEDPVARGDYDPRAATIEVQTEIRDDLLGEVASFLEEALIAPVEERSVALVVPFGSATDFRAYKEAWIRWKKMREDASMSVPQEADDLISRLEEYAVQIDQARQLRAELAKSLGAALKRQEIAAQAVHNWLKENLDGFKAFQRQRRQREQLIYRWRSIQENYRDFHDKINMPWCKNDAFTTPVYSFLDTWMPGRPNLDVQSLDQVVPKPEDLYIDLSAFETQQVPIVVPVLRPVQILVAHDTLNAPFVFDPSPTIPKLQPLPPIPSFGSGLIAVMPQVEVVGPPLQIAFPDVSISNDMSSKLLGIGGVIDGMSGRYRQFWDAVTKPRCGTPEAAKRCRGADPAAGDCCVKPGEEKYCRRGWSSDTCVHVEMDLLERFTRIGARPAVLLKEDFDVIGAWRTPGGAAADLLPCDPGDWACLNLHRMKQEPRYGWDTKMSTSSASAALDALRNRMFQTTLQSAGSASSYFPYQTPRDAIVPSLDVRKPIDLMPLSSLSSSASSP